MGCHRNGGACGMWLNKTTTATTATTEKTIASDVIIGNAKATAGLKATDFYSITGHAKRHTIFNLILSNSSKERIKCAVAAPSLTRARCSSPCMPSTSRFTCIKVIKLRLQSSNMFVRLHSCHHHRRVYFWFSQLRWRHRQQRKRFNTHHYFWCKFHRPSLMIVTTISSAQWRKCY